MKVCVQFQMMIDDKVDLRGRLHELEILIAVARTVVDYNSFINEGPEPLKFLQYDYDLVLGHFGIDFLHRQSRQEDKSPWNKIDPAPSPGLADISGWSEPGAPGKRPGD